MKELGALPDYWTRVLSESWPVKAGVACGAALAAIVFPNAAARTAGLAVVALVLLDTATGTMAARVTGDSISSAKFGRAMVKLFGYATAILAVALGFQALPGLH